MMTALDGKIMGSYMETPQGNAADGSPDTPPVFRAKEGLSQNRALGFGLKEAKVMDGGSVWLRYTINNQ